MDEEARLAESAWEKVVSVLGKPGHCKYVDRAAQSAVKSALRSQDAEAPGLADHIGREAEGFCTTKVTPEGRTLAILAAGTAVTVYTIMNYDEVEDAILEAAKKAKVPIKIPIPSQYGKLTAKIGFDAARVQWELKQANGLKLKTYFEQPYDLSSPDFGVGASRRFESRQLGSGSMNFKAGVNAEGETSVLFKLQFSF